MLDVEASGDEAFVEEPFAKLRFVVHTTLSRFTAGDLHRYMSHIP